MTLKDAINRSRIQKYAAFLKTQGLSDASIKRKLSSISTFEKFLVKSKLLESASNTTFSNLPLDQEPAIAKSATFANFSFKSTISRFQTRYFIVVALFIILTGLGYGVYSQTILKAKKELAYSTAAAPTTPNRILSFQGRLTDSSGNPISSSTGVVFKLFSTLSGGTSLYDSSIGNSQTVVPDANGIFSVVIGQSHGGPIPSSVFTENPNVFLEITSGGETMTPRQQIATVGYALNAETLQGLPPSASGFKNTVMVIDGSGNLNLGETSPSIKSISGTFGIEGQAVLIKSSTGSGGNITIAPDAGGTIKLMTSGLGTSTTNQIEASDANFLSGNLYSGVVANTNRTYNFIDFSNYNPATTTLQSRFSVTSNGNVNVGATLNAANISIGSTLISSSASEINLLHGLGTTTGSLVMGNGFSLTSLNPGTNGYILASNGAGSTLSWISTSSIGATYIGTNGLSLNVGVTNGIGLGGTLVQNTQIGTSSFNLSLGINTTSPTLFLSSAGNVGIGTSNPTKTLSVNGDIKISNNNALYFQDNSTNDINVMTYSTGNNLQFSNSSGAMNFSLNNGGDFTYGNNWAETMRITSNNRVGIGNTNPLYKLSVSGDELISGHSTIGLGTTNPLYTLNVGATTNVVNLFTSGSVGIGTTTFDTTNPEKLLVNAGITNSVNAISAKGSINNYLQLNIQNQSTGGTASSDLVATADNGSETSNYIDVGINGSNYANNFVGTANDTYLYGAGNNLIIANTTSSKDILFLTNGGANTNERMRLTSSGLLGIGTSSPKYNLDIIGTANFSSNVGIGGTNPLYLLNVGGTAGFNTIIATNAGTTSVVTNLNADYLDGFHSTAFLQVGYTGFFNTALNGLSQIGTTGIGLGGTLNQNTQIGTSSFNLSFVGLGGTQSLFIGATGFIGIGTTNPLYNLDITGSMNLTGTVFTAGTTGAIGQVLTSNGTGGLNWTTPAGSSYTAGNGITLVGTQFQLGGALTVGTSINLSSYNFDFFGAGNVGIGTTNPLYKLDVGSTANFVTIIATNAGSTAVVTNLNADLIDGYHVGSLPFMSTTTFTNGIVDVGNTASLGGALSVGTSINLNSNNFSFFGTGNFGLGTTSPKYNLDVIGSANFGSNVGLGGTNPLYLLNVGGTASFTNLFTLGNVGIGTSAPQAKLDVNGNMNVGGSATMVNMPVGTGSSIVYFNSVTGLLTQGSIGGFVSAGNGLSFVGAGATLGLGGTLSQYTQISTSSFNLSYLGLGNSLGFSQSSTGNVGIGTSAPNYKLDVIGTANFSSNVGIGGTNPLFGLNVGSTASFTNLFTTGNIGIGTSAPKYNFDVFGSANFGSNVGIGGTNPLFLLNVGGTAGFNTIIATSAGTTAVVTNLNADYLDGYHVTNLPFPTILTASNGISYLGGGSTLGIGGSLVQNTAIGVSSFNFMFNTVGSSNPALFIGSSGYVGIGVSYGVGSSFFPLEVGFTNSLNESVKIAGNIRGNRFESNSQYSNFYLDPGNSDINASTLSTHLYGSMKWNSTYNTVLSKWANIINASSTRIQGYMNGLGIDVNVGTTGIGDTLNWSTDEFFNGSGNVGIGTTNPMVKLNIFGSGSGSTLATTGVVDSTTNLRVARGIVGVDIGTLDGGNSYIQNRNFTNFATNYNLLLNPNGGAIGIGTTNVSQELTIMGSANQVIMTNTDFASGSAGSGLYLGTGVSSGNVYSQLQAFTNGNTVGGIFAINPWGGSVAIGLTTPTATLDIQTTNTTGSFGPTMIGNTANGDFSVNTGAWSGTNWNVGSSIATHIVAGANPFTLATGTGVTAPIAGHTYQITFTIGTSTPSALTGLAMSFGGSSGYAVGGQTGPDTEVQVVTAANTNGLIFTPDATWLGNLKNVAVKEVITASVSQNIRNSNGSIGVELRAGGVGLTNTFIGGGAGLANVSGNYNVGLGSLSLYSNTTGTANSALGYMSLFANTTGNYNEGIGYKALQKNTTGSYNNAIGVDALFFNNAGNYNNAMGFYSLEYNTTGSNNTAIGNQVLQNNTTGNLNTAVGNGALNVNSSGSWNTGLGDWALVSNTTGNYNTAVGEAPLRSNATGNNNVAIGYNAAYFTNANSNIAIGSLSMYTNTSGYYNIGIGSSALYANNGVANIGIGRQALYSNSTSNFNTAVGDQALYSATGGDNSALGSSALYGLTTGTDNTAVGYNAMVNGAAGSYNTAVGEFALQGTLTNAGYYNTATGANSLHNDTSGQLNVASGWWALYSNTSGNENTGIGHNALHTNSGGSYNTALGGYSGYSNNNADNTFIGYDSGYLSTGSNNVTVGYYTGYNSGGGVNNTYVGQQAGYNGSGSNSVLIGNSAGYTSTGNNNVMIGTGAGQYNNGSSSVFIGYGAGQNETNSNMLYIANTNTAYPLISGNFVNGHVGFGVQPNATYGYYLNGNGYLAGATAWAYGSDRKLKQNISYLSDSGVNATNIIKNLRPATFDYIVGDKNQVGFIAQDIQPYLPHLVGDNGTNLTLQTDELIPYLVKSNQEIDSRVSSLEASIGSNLSYTSDGQANLTSNIDQSVLDTLGYAGSKNEIQAATYSLTDSTGKVITSVVQFGQVFTAKITAGLVSTTNLIAQNIVAETTKSKTIQTSVISPLSDVSDTIIVNGKLAAQGVATTTLSTDTLTANTATVTTLYANKIVSQEGDFGQIMTAKIAALRSELQNSIASIASSSATADATPSAIVADSASWTFDTGASQVSLDGSLSLSDNMVIGGKLSVIGDASLGNAFISGTFTAGQIAIKDNLIETTNTALYIQPSGLGSVHILNDTMVIADNGEVTINGKLSLNGSLTAQTASISGSIFGDMVAARNASISGTLTAGAVDTGKISIATSSSTPVIASAQTSSDASSSAQFTANATAGTVTLPAGKTELVIYNPKISSNSMVYLTPVGSTSNQVVYLKSKFISPTPTPDDASASATAQSNFVIALDQPLTKDVDINWWIIN